MARYTGKDLAIMWVTSLGTTWLEGDFRSMTTTEDQESADSTAGNDTYKAYIPTVADASGEVQLLDSSLTANTALWAAIAPATAGTLTWYPEGTATGKNTHSAPAFISSRQREFPYDDVVTITASYQFTAPVTAGTVAA
jgi:hypothetical protein